MGIVEVNSNETQTFEFWDYCQALTSAIRLTNAGYKARVEEI